MTIVHSIHTVFWYRTYKKVSKLLVFESLKTKTTLLVSRGLITLDMTAENCDHKENLYQDLYQDLSQSVLFLIADKSGDILQQSQTDKQKADG